MSIFAIGDLHLPGGQEKPMVIFGEHWHEHFQQICYDWATLVQPHDIVLIPGDISWAMTLAQVKQDIVSIAELPGTKVIMRGNHDYWWSSVGQVRSMLPEGMLALQNNAFLLQDCLIAGTRGWKIPGSRDFEQQDEKIYLREVHRLGLSLAAARKLSDQAQIIVMMHYPPFNERQEDNGFTDLYKEYGVAQVIYGHLHGKSILSAFSGVRDGVQYNLVSCDALGFRLHQIV